MGKCPIHYKGQEYWAVALCPLCNNYLENNMPNPKIICCEKCTDYDNDGGKACWNPSCSCHTKITCCENCEDTYGQCEDGSCECHITKITCCKLCFYKGYNNQTDSMEKSCLDRNCICHTPNTKSEWAWKIEFNKQFTNEDFEGDDLLIERLMIFIQNLITQAGKEGYERGKSYYLAGRYFGEQKLDVVVHESKELELKFKQVIADAKAQGFKEAVEIVRQWNPNVPTVLRLFEHLEREQSLLGKRGGK